MHVADTVVAPRTESRLFPSKITWDKAQQSVQEAGRRYPGKRIVALVDQDLELNGVEIVHCRRVSVGQFMRQSFQDTVFLYACDSDEIGWPFVELIISRRGTFLPVMEATPSLYIHINDTARQVLEAEYADQVAAGFAKWDFGPHDFINLIQAIDMTAKLDGAFVEVGCYRGSSGCAALRYMREIRLRRACYFLDVFEGFNYDEAQASADAYWLNSHKTEGLEQVEARLRKYEAPGQGPTVSVIKSNIIEDDLPATAERICVANIDVDMYEAVLAGLNKLAPRIVPGGILIVEDPGHTPLLIGARVALNHFLMSPAARGFTPLYMQSGQTFLLRT